MLTREELSSAFKSSCVRREGFNLMCLTFNVNAKVEDSFDNLLRDMLKSNAETLPDILVVGLQEVVPLNAQNVIGANLFAESQEVIDRWMWLILTALSRLEGIYDQDNGTVNPYELLIKEQMVGLWICVISSGSLRPAIKNVQKASCPRGVGGVFGNKGATCVRFDVHDSSICVVNAHFAAHRGHVQHRNNDFHAILNKEMFTDPFLAVGSGSEGGKLTEGSLSAELSSLEGGLNALRDKLAAVAFEEEGNGQEEEEGQSESQLRDSAATVVSQEETGIRDSRLTILEEEERTTRATIRRSDVDLVARGSENRSPFPEPGGSATASAIAKQPPLQSSLAAHRMEHKLAPNDHDIVIWLGDLNYRIDVAVADEDVFQMVEMNRIEELAELDQLNIEKDRGAVFEGFHEGVLQFPPTYKFIRGTDSYDQRPEKKIRTPSWCDRVLWRTASSRDDAMGATDGYPIHQRSAAATCSSLAPGSGWSMPYENVELMCYSRGNSLISDHKPVFASLNVNVKRVDWGDCEQLLLDVMEELAFYDGDIRGALHRGCSGAIWAVPETINLHSLPPVGDKVQLQLTNSLDCPVSYCVLAHSVPSWLHLDPLSTVLLPGKSITLKASVDHIEATTAFGNYFCKLDALVDCPSAMQLLSNRPEITGIVVLQLKALKEKPAGPELWTELEPQFAETGSLAEKLIPVVCLLGQPIPGDVSS